MAASADTELPFPPDPEAQRGRLLARPGDAPASGHPVLPGLRPLGLGGAGGRDGLLMVPAGVEEGATLPLLVLLHGAGGHARGMLRLLEAEARQAGVALLVPESRGVSWDVITGRLGPDVAFLDAALRRAFAELPVDEARLAIGGFSDGASYALTLGMANGDLFRWVLAFSPGFAVPPEVQGSPRLYICHGKADQVLPIDRCSRRLVPRLRRAGYSLHYREFEGGHELPAACAAEALAPLRGG